ncbi:MAG TPA: hypothetical protein VKE88_03470, partial [Candidatus Nanoarchaeia archaeon]|nr:hypothetical protein [Candidatus Nanoarchaeia archaeon]
ESLVDEFIVTRGLSDEYMRSVVGSILIYGTPSLAKQAKKYFHQRRLMIPIEIVTEEEAKKRQGNGYFAAKEKRPYHFRIYQRDLERYRPQK